MWIPLSALTPLFLAHTEKKKKRFFKQRVKILYHSLKIICLKIQRMKSFPFSFSHFKSLFPTHWTGAGRVRRPLSFIRSFPPLQTVGAEPRVPCLCAKFCRKPVRVSVPEFNIFGEYSESAVMATELQISQNLWPSLKQVKRSRVLLQTIWQGDWNITLPPACFLLSAADRGQPMLHTLLCDEPVRHKYTGAVQPLLMNNKYSSRKGTTFCERADVHHFIYQVNHLSRFKRMYLCSRSRHPKIVAWSSNTYRHLSVSTKQWSDWHICCLLVAV